MRKEFYQMYRKLAGRLNLRIREEMRAGKIKLDIFRGKDRIMHDECEREEEDSLYARAIATLQIAKIGG